MDIGVAATGIAAFMAGVMDMDADTDTGAVMDTDAVA
jgi:hypothetical protein